MKYLSRGQIAEVFGISPKQAGRLMMKMPTVSVGTTHRRVKEEDFLRWLEENTRQPPLPKTRLKRRREVDACDGAKSSCRSSSRIVMRPLPPL